MDKCWKLKSSIKALLQNIFQLNAGFQTGLDGGTNTTIEQVHRFKYITNEK